jgi:hypothetical protein
VATTSVLLLLLLDQTFADEHEQKRMQNLFKNGRVGKIDFGSTYVCMYGLQQPFSRRKARVCMYVKGEHEKNRSFEAVARKWTS